MANQNRLTGRDHFELLACGKLPPGRNVIVLLGQLAEAFSTCLPVSFKLFITDAL
jgi:hypothetical protein